FGSRVDVLFGPEWEITVQQGVRVLAGSSVIARRPDSAGVDLAEARELVGVPDLVNAEAYQPADRPGLAGSATPPRGLPVADAIYRRQNFPGLSFDFAFLSRRHAGRGGRGGRRGGFRDSREGHRDRGAVGRVGRHDRAPDA